MWKGCSSSGFFTLSKLPAKWSKAHPILHLNRPVQVPCTRGKRAKIFVRSRAFWTFKLAGLHKNRGNYSWIYLNLYHCIPYASLVTHKRWHVRIPKNNSRMHIMNLSVGSVLDLNRVYPPSPLIWESFWYINDAPKLAKCAHKRITRVVHRKFIENRIWRALMSFFFLLERL